MIHSSYSKGRKELELTKLGFHGRTIKVKNSKDLQIAKEVNGWTLKTNILSYG